MEGIHVISLALSVGLVIWFDLRLAGLILTDQPVSAVFRPIRPYMLTGFGIMFATGLALFWALALRCYASPFFWIKMTLLLIAGVNIAFYHFTIDRRQPEWDTMEMPPRRARMAGIISLVVWIGVIAAGRLMAYFL